MQDDPIERRRGLIQLFLERVGLGELLGGEFLVQSEELVDADVLAHRAPEELLDPQNARFGRKLVEKLRQLGRALAVRGDLDVVKQEYLVEADLQVRNEVLAQECIDPALDGLPDGRVAGRGRPDRVLIAARIVVRRARDADVRALERRAQPDSRVRLCRST